MAGVSRKPEKDRSLDFKGFLKDMNSYDYMFKDKDQKSKRPLMMDTLIDEKLPDAASEKELGNEFFKQKKYREAIECYTRSIVLSPTAVAFANRAMAYIKLKRFVEAENDCSEALNLDDRYIKAYSRRATARKELGKLEGSLQDAEFAMSLEPNNPELRKQYTEARTMLEKEVRKRKSGALKGVDNSGIAIDTVSGNHSKTVPTSVQTSNQGSNGKVSSKPLISVDVNGKSLNGSAIMSSMDSAIMSSMDNSVKIHQGISRRKRDLDESMQDVASRAASRIMASAIRNISAPKSAYEFEVSWRALSADSEQQVQLLKAIPPATLPLIFKNALSAPMLIEIIRCTATFFKEDTDIAVSHLENLAQVPRFDVIVMCLSALDHAEIHRLWNEVFSSTDIQADHVEKLSRLRPKYCHGELQARSLGSTAWPK